MPKAVVALSGGVDSAVAAVLLQEEGVELTGVTMRLWPQSRCCDEKDIEDAADLCARLEIPYRVLDYRERFREMVVDPFIAGYAAGLTPNPCARCNQLLKFDALWQEARSMGADILATGHYARLGHWNGAPVLLRGVDQRKDQSYFLFGVSREILPHLRFPVGEMDKETVRGIARRLGIPLAGKSDSQDICFVPGGDYRAFLGKQGGATGALPGDIVRMDGEIVGQHDGISGYTVGQRRGLGGGSGEPLYVVGLDANRNEIRVGPASALFRDRVSLHGCRWLVPDWDGGGSASYAVQVKLRYAAQPAAARLYLLPEGRGELLLDEPQRAVTPGQAAVCYDGDRLLGGGWIAVSGDGE